MASCARLKPSRVLSIGLNEACSSGRRSDQFTLVAQPKSQPSATIRAKPVSRVSVVERSERILIHSLVSTRANVTVSTATTSESSEVGAGRLVS